MCYEYLELSVETWVCVWSADRGCEGLRTGGDSPTGGAVMGGKTGREEGIMYSDSSSLSRASSPVTDLKAEDDLRTNNPRIFMVEL